MSYLFKPLLISLLLVACVQREPSQTDRAIKLGYEILDEAKSLAAQRDTAMQFALKLKSELERSMSQTETLIGLTKSAFRQRDSLKVLLDKCRGIKFRPGVEYIFDSLATKFIPDGIIVNLKNDTIPF
jgi:hypothetical protein